MKSFFSKKLLPAVTLDDSRSALLLAETYLEAGLDIMEITFRTPAAPEAISAVIRKFPEMHIGAGTVLTPDELTAAQDAGAQFGLAPGCNRTIVQAAAQSNFPFIPGVTTPSEIETALELGCELQKLFPVNHLGGPDYIKTLQGPYEQTGLSFIPMGNINESNMVNYLQLPMVTAVGGSWPASKKLILEGAFQEIGRSVKQALEIAGTAK